MRRSSNFFYTHTHNDVLWERTFGIIFFFITFSNVLIHLVRKCRMSHFFDANFADKKKMEKIRKEKQKTHNHKKILYARDNRRIIIWESNDSTVETMRSAGSTNF